MVWGVYLQVNLTFDALAGAVEWWDIIPGRWRESNLKLHVDHFHILSLSIKLLFKGTTMSIMVGQLYFEALADAVQWWDMILGRWRDASMLLLHVVHFYIQSLSIKGALYRHCDRLMTFAQIFVFDIYQSTTAAACLEIQISIVGFQFIPVSASRGQNSSSWNLRNPLHHINLPWWLNGWEWGRW